MAHEPPLPRLAFGNNSAVEFHDEAACGEFLARLPDAPSRFGGIGPRAAFHIRLRNVVLPDVSLVTGASSPKATDHCGRRPAIVIPFGDCATVLRAGRQEFHWAAPHHAFLVPAGQTIDAESTTGSFLRLDIMTAALERTAAGMAGLDGSRRPPLDLATARPLALQHNGINWLPVIRSLGGMIDAFDCDATQLTMAGIDDVILRMAVMLLCPELAATSPTVAPPARGFDLDPLLEQIMANLGGRVTLADMERWSDRTARAIQLAFQKRFGMKPMEWVRERRLELVHAALRTAWPGTTVAEVAGACGLPRMATLIPHYVRRFGEHPSATLRGNGR
jgi:AraC-like DNA-binding protein